VHNLCCHRQKGTLSLQQIQQLDNIGFVWNADDAHWDMMFELLTFFLEEKKNCLVPQNCHVSGKNLGHWVKTQRLRKGKPSAQRIKRLDDIGFVWRIYAPRNGVN
jgi:hypothetical protein